MAAFPIVKNHHVTIEPEGPSPKVLIYCNVPAAIKNEVIRFSQIMWSKHWLLPDWKSGGTAWSVEPPKFKEQLGSFLTGSRGRNTVDQLYGGLADITLGLAQAEMIRFAAKTGAKSAYREASRLLLRTSAVAHNVAVDLNNAVSRQHGITSIGYPPRLLAQETFEAHRMVRKAVGFFIRRGF